MKIYKKLIASILTLMMIFTQVSVSVFADNEEAKIPLDIVLVLDVSGSMDDSIGNSTRIKILQNSINQFIDVFADSNSNKSDKNKQSRISIIKFAGKKCVPENKEGNDTYLDGAYRYNYTQIVSHYFTVTNENKNQLKDKVNAISPAGATQSDYGMELAQSVINDSVNDSARKNAKRVVLFLTDGKPTDFSDFNGDVADGAIAASKEVKKYAEVYSIGMFTETNPTITGHTGSGDWTEDELFNAYMHGVSSNYPDAVDYKTLGTRADNSGYYMGVKSSDDATTVFENIIDGLLSLKYEDADYTNVDAAIAKVPNDLNIYTEETVNALQSALDAVERGKDVTEQDVVDGYAEAINAAIETLKLKNADYTEVDKAIAKANALNKNNYVDFSKVTAAMSAVNRDKKITQQSEVDAMAKAINDAIDHLVLKGADYTEVNEAIDKVPSDLSVYTEETVKTLQDALKAVREGKDITEQAIVDNYAKAINKAIAGLLYKDADYTAVKKAIEIANKLDKNNYVDFTEVIKAINAVDYDKKINQQFEVDAMAKVINDVLGNLVLKDADYTKVDEAIARANALNKDNYIDFSKVIEAINAVDRNKKITEQAVVNGYAETINNAINALVKKNIDYTVIGGANSTFVKNSEKVISIRINHEFTNNIKVEVDNQEIDKDNYIVLKGSTIITFNDTYLNTLSVGTHTVKITFIDGIATTYLTIKESEMITPDKDQKNDEKKESITANRHLSNKQDTDKKTKKIQTGDNTNIMFFISLFGIGLLGIYCFVVNKYTH